jgi:hypothetical protein
LKDGFIPPAGIGKNEGFNAQTFHYLDREGDIHGGVAFIQMETPLHEKDSRQPFRVPAMNRPE